jgi:integrase
MPRPKTLNPSYLLHPQSGQARVRIREGNRYRDIYLGKYNSPESWEKYHRILAERLRMPESSLTCSVGDGEDLTLSALVLKYDDFCRLDGKSSQERYAIGRFANPLIQLYGKTLAKDFGPNKLRTVREQIISAGREHTAIRDAHGNLLKSGDPLSRGYVNNLTKSVMRMFRWAASHELVPASAHDALTKLEGIRKGKEPRLREMNSVKPVPEQHIDPVVAVASPQIATMIQVQCLTGMRPDEVTIIRPCDLDRCSEIWIFRPSKHKLDWLDFKKEILIGPKAQELLLPWLEGREPTDYLFSPREVAEENARALENRRKTPTGKKVRLSQKRKPREHYDDRGYRQAVIRACKRAGVPEWSPGQLRHNTGTKVRALFGVEAAQTVLGHHNLSTTEIYAEKNHARYKEIMSRIG